MTNHEKFLITFLKMILLNILFPDRLVAQDTNVGRDMDGCFEYDIIECFLDLIDKDSVHFELTNKPPKQT